MREDVDISEETGLPETPEGLFWRIRERPKYRFKTEERTDDGELWVELCTHGMVNEVYQTTPKLTWKNVWTYWLLKDSVTAVRDVPGIVVLSEDVMADFKYCSWGHSSEALSQEYTESAYQDSYSRSTRFVRLMEPTTENVQKLATSVLEMYLNEQERLRVEALKAQQRQALVGTYPPKKLEN